MSTGAFDAVITLDQRYIIAAGLSGRETDAVRTPVEAIDGACAIDVEA